MENNKIMAYCFINNIEDSEVERCVKQHQQEFVNMNILPDTGHSTEPIDVWEMFKFLLGISTQHPDTTFEFGFTLMLHDIELYNMMLINNNRYKRLTPTESYYMDEYENQWQLY